MTGEQAQAGTGDGKTYCLRAPSRLHFGLLSWGRMGRQFGGVGVMIERPGIELAARSSDRFVAHGPCADRVEQFARLWAAHHERDELPAMHVTVRQAPPEHVGLGVGTQLGLAVAELLARWSNLPRPSAAELAASVRRGQRSAIGSHGFRLGGLIYERGKESHERLAPLGERVELPAAWRFVLIRPSDARGLHGVKESSAFASLPAVDPAVSQKLRDIAERQLLPAARDAQFEAFCQAVFEYGWRAGMCFAAEQGGPFNGPVVTRLVEQLRRWGVTGVGQSSWGPTVFALMPDRANAEDLVARLQSSADSPWITEISPVDNRGAQVSACAERNA